MINCKFENGNKASLRHVVVDAIVFNRGKDKILLVKRSPKLTEGGKWGLVGGFLDRDETSAEGMLREIKEETGYDGKILGLLRVNDRPFRKGEDRQNVALVYLVEAQSKKGESDWEVTDLKWWGIKNLPAEDEVAFDHYECMKLIPKYLSDELSLPIIG